MPMPVVVEPEVEFNIPIRAEINHNPAPAQYEVGVLYLLRLEIIQ